MSKAKPKILYHGTSEKSALNIIKRGVDMRKCSKGYFGVGFYMADDFALAKSNYADFSEDCGFVLTFELSEKARILDLSRKADYEKYMSMKVYGNPISGMLFLDNIDKIFVSLGVDGIKDRSFGGIVIYNKKVIKLVRKGIEI